MKIVKFLMMVEAIITMLSLIFTIASMIILSVIGYSIGNYVMWFLCAIAICPIIIIGYRFLSWLIRKIKCL